jgi:hypothetical protein
LAPYNLFFSKTFSFQIMLPQPTTREPASLQSLQDQFDQLSKLLAERDTKHAAEMQKQLAERDAKHAAEMQKQLAERDAKYAKIIEALDAHIKAQDARIKAQDARIKAQDEEIIKLKAKVHGGRISKSRVVGWIAVSPTIISKLTDTLPPYSRDVAPPPYHL